MPRSVILAVALGMALAHPLLAAARVTFIRIIPPQHDLRPAERIAVISAIGDSDKIGTFVDHLVGYAGRSGTLRVENAVENNQHAVLDEASLKILRRRHPADAYLGVSIFTCTGTERSGEGSETNVDGERVKSKVRWIDAVCSARIDVRAPNGKRTVTFMTHGEGTSPRVRSVTDEERDIAYEQAARYAALTAADSITPRMIRESIELDESAPLYEEGAAMVTSDRLGGARAIWEAALRRHRDSAALQFNLAAVCEALGDLRAAHDYYRSAVRLSPSESRYRVELDLFRRRNGLRRK